MRDAELMAELIVPVHGGIQQVRHMVRRLLNRTSG